MQYALPYNRPKNQRSLPYRIYSVSDKFLYLLIKASIHSTTTKLNSYYVLGAVQRMEIRILSKTNVITGCMEFTNY